MPLHVESVGAGPDLVLLHGWGMHGGLWGSLPARLAARHRVHVVDLPGHGHSRDVIARNLREMVDAVAGAFGHHARLIVLGWSLGALVALQWAIDAPDRVGRLILTGATPKFVKSVDWPFGIDETALARFADELVASYRLTLQRFLSLQMQGTDPAHATLSAMRHGLFARGEPSQAALRTGLYILRITDLRSVVGAIEQPTLVIGGDRDTLTPAGASRWLGEHVSHANLHVIAGAAHVPFLSHAQAFDRALEPFVHAA